MEADDLVLATWFANLLFGLITPGDGRIKRGDIVVLEAMGGGLTWGSGVIRW